MDIGWSVWPNPPDGSSAQRLYSTGWTDMDKVEILTGFMIYPWLGVVAFFFLGQFWFARRMWKERKPSATAEDVMGNPFNICLLPHLLTEEGLRARRSYFLCWVGVLITVASPIVLIVLMKVM
jgi:hypothetical protein